MLVLFLLLIAVAGTGWHFSRVLLSPVNVIQYPDVVRSVRNGQVLLAPSHWAGQPGTWALRWTEGRTVVGPVADSSSGVVARPLLGSSGPEPPAGAAVVLDAGPYDAPAELGLASRTVPVRTALGHCPAWFVPASRSTWVIAVHGRGADRRECLRVLPTLHRLGHPVLAITYRNDRDAPVSPDGHYHLGDTEWLDVAAAVEYARRNGATDLVLYGWSMGGAITGAYLDRAAGTREWAAGVAAVRAVVWDSPVLDWRATLRQQARLRRLPPGFTRVASLITSWRIGIDFARFDLVRRPPSTRPPTLLFHGDSDTAVPVGPARALASSAARLGWPLRYVEVPGAEHTAAWNVDPEGYETEVARFLTEHAAGTDTPVCPPVRAR